MALFDAPRLDYRASGGRLPDFASASVALAAALPALIPPARITVSRAAELYRRIDSTSYRGPWRNDVAPYMVEPMDMITSRRFNACVFVGPARSAKTDSLIMNSILHGVVCNPRHMLVVHMSKDSARDFSLEKLNPMIAACDKVRERLVRDRGGDNIFDKRFTGGMRLSIGWPVVSKLSARDLPFVGFTDYDRMDDDIGEEGDPFSLGRKRTQTFGSLGMTAVESSPGRPVLDEGWSPKTPHEAPPTTGILGLYNRGTRARYYWTCPSCGREIEPTFDRLKYDEAAPPLEAGMNCYMLCPTGCIIPKEAKADLNNEGRWLHENDAGGLVEIDEDVRSTDIVSYWLPGPPACFQSWGELVARHLEAQAHFELTGDEGPLKSTVTLDQGRPFLSRAQGDDGALNEERLKSRALRLPTREAPAGTRFITIQVDVQGSYFPVQVDAWGEGLERWMVDRFDLHTPPETAPGADSRAVDPARYAEDWAVLLPLKDLIVPVAGSDRGLKPVLVVVDSAGRPGVTDRAYGFWRACKKKGFGRNFRLVKGVGGFRCKRAVQGYPETAHKGRKAVARDIPIISIGVDRLKDEVAASLSREAAGPGAYHLLEGLPANVFAELAAERRMPNGWERKAGGRRNEAFDLSVYGKASAIVLKAESINRASPPAWAKPVAQNSFSVGLAESEVAQSSEPSSEAAITPVRRSRFSRLRGR